MRTILLVDDHPLMSAILGAVAHAVFGDATILTARDLEEALALASEAASLDLVLLDLGLPGCSGLEALTRFREAHPQTRVVVVSATEDRDAIVRALEAGAAGYIPKTHAPPLISAALRLVAAGGTYVPPQILAVGDDLSSAALTARQLEVLRLIAKGMANREIAQRLGIASETVKRHASALYAALGVQRRGQAPRAASRRGIKLD